MASKLTELRRINLGPTRFNVSLVIVAGSILDYEGDAFVNAANEGCTGGFGVDEQVNKAGGFELKEARKQFGGCQTGQCKVSGSYDHKKVKHIIHAVGPVYRLKFGMHEGPSDENLAYLKTKDPALVSAYKTSLEAAKELNVQKLGFTLLCAGVFRGQRDLEDILNIGVQALMDNCYDGLTEVTLVAWTEEEQKTLVEVVDSLTKNL